MTAPLANASTISPDEAMFQQDLLTDLKTVQAALDYWTGYLKRKYAITSQDRITENGAILRGIATPAQPPAPEQSVAAEA